jgi:hypothetical protein
MARKTGGSTATSRAASSTEDVESFLVALDHPAKQEIPALRQLILAADKRIGEDIKWKVPSFRTSEHFATLHLRAKQGVAVILHFGAKQRSVAGIAIADPDALLRWLADDRAMVTFRDLHEVAKKQRAFTDLIREWIRHV